MKHILVTGGAGYIGSHTVLELVQKDYHIHVVDNFCNSSMTSLDRVGEITGKRDAISVTKADLRDLDALRNAVRDTGKTFSGVIHFAALKAVGESISKPLEYYENNIQGLINLLKVCIEFDIRDFVFSSSSTVYGIGTPPYSEESPTGMNITNPYGQTKHMCEVILKDFQHANPSFRILSLRYFNPVGAHKSGRIGEDPQGIPNNLMPYIQRVAVGALPRLTVHGNDYDTADGTAERDYIHVVDLARGHVEALRYLESCTDGLYDTINVGTGTKYSVLQVVEAFRKASKADVPYEIGPRRPGDAPATWAIATKAEEKLGWKAEHDMDEICEDSWRWISKNPKGYDGAAE